MHGPERSLSCERIWDELWWFAQPDVPAWMSPITVCACIGTIGVNKHQGENAIFSANSNANRNKTVMRAVYRLQEKA